MLEYHVPANPQRPPGVVGAILGPGKHRFGLLQGRALTRPLSLELIEAHESGLVNPIGTKYFGKTH